MADPDWDGLARAHMSKQVADAATVQAALARLWEETIHPGYTAVTFAKFQERAVPLIMAGRSISKAEAQRYFEAVHNLSGLDSDLADVYDYQWPERAAKSSLSAASGKALARAEALHRAGAPSAATFELAKRAMLASAKRQMLNAGRERITGLTRTSGYGRWARVSDGNPCAFCLMLVGRGPVYTHDSVRFRAHDGCGCSARPVLANESGWTPQAREARDLYDRLGGLGELRARLDARKRAETLGLAA
ncbi:MuF-like minor capsid protein [Microbacterium phage Zeta1847]|uniref:MuF-like minor capsid protein n=1 Tax=Microbacterium phage Zeta1847 TaxID=2201444 RepID=A0A2Z4QAT5_9CAUD|nr:head maturation protease [Microbacterium phage Zeta1847]AWY06638.1 MuF-like minor capsid protein [Microbacterium phage Zeta1847]